MSRWKYPFNSIERAEKFLDQAQRETGRSCFVRQVSLKAYLFKIFSSEKEYQQYQNKKRIRHGRK